MKPRVTVVIIFLNAERFLQEAIASVFAQTLEAWELLLVDDGSCDASGDIGRQYAREHPTHIRYLTHPGGVNRGMGASRNLGWREARAEFVAFLDADDVWLPQKLEQQLAIMARSPEAALLYGRTLMWYGWTKRPTDTGQDYLRPLGVRPNRLVAAPELFLLWLRTDLVPSTSNILVRRRTFERFGGYDDNFRTTYSDLPFYLKVFLNATVFVCSECWDWYRQHDSNSVRLALAAGEWHPEQPNPARRRLLQWVDSYLSQARISAPCVRSALRAELRPYRYPAVTKVLRTFGVVKSKREIRPAATILWHAHGVDQVEIRIDKSNGPLLATGAALGTTTTGPWVRDGIRFFLLDASASWSEDGFAILAAVDLFLTNEGWQARCGAVSLLFETDWAGGEELATGVFSWISQGTEQLELRLAAPDGLLVSRSGSVANNIRVDWLRPALVFYLQDVSGGLPLTGANTLATIVISAKSKKLQFRTASLDVRPLAPRFDAKSRDSLAEE